MARAQVAVGMTAPSKPVYRQRPTAPPVKKANKKGSRLTALRMSRSSLKSRQQVNLTRTHRTARLQGRARTCACMRHETMAPAQQSLCGESATQPRLEDESTCSKVRVQNIVHIMSYDMYEYAPLPGALGLSRSAS